MHAVYVLCHGQDDNIGDIVLRRHLLKIAERCGSLHVYLGDASEGFKAGLQLGSGVVVYKSYFRWWLDLFKDALKGRAIFFRNAGEIGGISFCREVPFLLLLPLLKFSGGIFVIGAGVRHGFPFYRKTMLLPLLWSTDLCYWRDDFTRSYFAIGKVAPDLAFGDRGPRQERLDLLSENPRSKLVLSLRSDRVYPSGPWIEGLLQFARQNALDIVVITQVERDGERSRELAGELGAALADWDGQDHLQQEIKLRSIYREARIVLSDRLHVLIVGLTEGALPICLVPHAESKVKRHFEAIGLEGVSINCAGWSAQEIARSLTESASRIEPALKALQHAREKVGDLEKEIAAKLKQLFP